MRRAPTKSWSCFSLVIIISICIATVGCALFSRFDPLFVLDDNQLLYLFSALAQIIGGVFSLTLAAYVFFANKLKENTKDDETYYDATTAVLNKNFFILILLAISCALTLCFCIAGIIVLHNRMMIYPFIINESVSLFIICIISILIFGVALLDPAKIDKEIAKMKRNAEDFFQGSASTNTGDFGEFLKLYNMLEHTIIEFARECTVTQDKPNSSYRPQIIQSLNVLLHNEIINSSLLNTINELRMFRNALIHGVDFHVSQDVCDRISEIYLALHNALEV